MSTQDDDNNNNYCRDDDNIMEDVSILADDAQQGLPRVRSEFEIDPQDHERFNNLLPPIHQIVVPVRRRAHTVDVECGLRTASSEDNGNLPLTGVHHHHHHQSKCSDTAPDDASLSSLEGDLLGEDANANRGTIPATPPSLFTPSRGNLRWSLSEEGRQRRRRQKLLSSRCVRGFAALCVYGILVLQPSTSSLMDTAVPKPLDAPVGAIALNSTSSASGSSSSSSSSNRRASEQTAPKMKMAALPKFHHPPQHSGRHPVYRSTMPPNAINSITKTNGTVTRWHKIPPDPPTIYHKKQRPILSHAHSYQLHQEPLVFGREQKTSFLLDDGSDDKDGIPWTSTLIWLSLLVLFVDTSYREWQHHRWHRQFMRSIDQGPTQTISAMQRRQRRSYHYRRSPSPEPRRRRFDSF